MSTLWRLCRTCLLILNYYVFSISITFYNKKVLTDYPFPMSITILHLLVKFLIAWLLRRLVGCAKKSPVCLLGWKDYLKSICPVAIFSSLDIGLSNWSLVYITVSLYTMSKSTSLIFILMFAVIFRLEKPRLLQILVVILIVIGLFMFTFETTSFELEGLLLVLSASVVTGLRWSTAQLTLQKQELGLSNPIDMVYHLQPIMILTLTPLAFFIDGVHMGTSRHIFLASNSTTVAYTSLYLFPSALLGFMLGISEYLLVFHTSGLTLSVSGVVKEVILLTISTMLVEDSSLNSVKVVGMVMCILGVAVHSGLKALRLRDEEKENKVHEDLMELLPPTDRPHPLHNEASTDSEDSIIIHEATTKL